MGQILHGCATTTEAVRRAIQNSQESLRGLAKRYGINQKTVAKWKQRETVADLQASHVNSAFYRGGSDHRRFPAAYAAVARRLPLRTAADHPTSHAVIPAPQPQATRHQPIAGDRRQ